jgi:hypothetical protein
MHQIQPVTSYHVPDLLYRIHFRSAAISKQFGVKAERFISSHIDIGSHTTEVVATSTAFNIEAINGNSIRTIVNLKRMNDIENINEFIATVNRKLPDYGLYIGCVETIDQRRCRILNKFPKVISYPFYGLDFLLKRVFPKWGPTRRIYKLLTRGNNRALSITETLGRLYIFGFNIEEYVEVGKLTYFVVRKIGRPVMKTEPFYGMIIRLRRVGKDGKLFDVFKFRTMHPYAEYLQEYIYKTSGLAKGDKAVNDFRITSWGRFMRKLWLDELPMWINWIKGDVKLVGVRPLSKNKLSLYPWEFQLIRNRYKPGLIPPFYTDLPESLEELVASEKKYLNAYDAHPWLTDMRYFWMSVYNIAVKGARSA